MEFIDYYKILGIPKTATEKEIKTAYRKLARKYHPDLNPNNKEAERRFKEINEANEVVSDPEKRKKYDEHGKDWMHADEIKKARQQQQSQRAGNTQEGYGDFTDDFSAFFESMYGDGGNKRRQTKFRGQDLNAELHLDLKDVYKSQKQTLTVNGKKIRLTFPAGIENGQVIKISGHGTQGANGGPNGDLYITFSIQNDTKFKREGSSLYATADLDLYTAMLGGDVLIDTFDGKAKLKIAPETQPGTKVKLKGKGFPVYKKENEFGDLFITFQIKLPTSLTDKEKMLFTELKKTEIMETSNLVLIEQICSNCDVELSFIDSLNDYGLIEIIVLEDKHYISTEQLKSIERAIRFHYELNINIEGIDAISNLLNQIDDLQRELTVTKNKLKLFELE